MSRDYALPIDENGKCVLANVVNTECEGKKKSTKNPPMKWECTSECKKLTEAEVGTIIDLKAAFQHPIQDVRNTLDSCDSECPNQHYTKCSGGDVFELHGHPLVCSNDGGCHSKLRILKSAAIHFPVLSTFLRLVCCALESHKTVQSIDEALCTGDFQSLMDITKVSDFETLFSNELENSYEQCTEAADSVLVKPGVENQLLVTHAKLIAQLEKEIDDYPEHVCVSCQCLYQRKSVTKVELSDNLSSNVWPRIKDYVLGQNPNAGKDETLYMCNYCKSFIKKR